MEWYGFHGWEPGEKGWLTSCCWLLVQCVRPLSLPKGCDGDERVIRGSSVCLHFPAGHFGWSDEPAIAHMSRNAQQQRICIDPYVSLCDDPSGHRRR